MAQQLLTESPEKTKQQIARREVTAEAARSVHDGFPSPILQLHRALGNQRVAQLIQAKRLTPQGQIRAIQPKLTVGAADDQYEQEADRVARRVVSMPDSVALAAVQPTALTKDNAGHPHSLQSKPLLLAASITPFVQRKIQGANNREEDQEQDKPKEVVQARRVNDPVFAPLQRQEASEKEGDEPVQAKRVAGTSTEALQRQASSQEEERDSIQTKSTASLAGSFDAGVDVESRLSQSKGGGSPLPDPVRSFMEPRFGVDFGHVRIHTGSHAIQMNRDVGAQAFTHGADIYYGAGSSPTNLDLTAHELTHVVQQTGGKPLQTKKQAQPRTLGPEPPVQRTCAACSAGAAPCATCATDNPETVQRRVVDEKGPTQMGQGTVAPVITPQRAPLVQREEQKDDPWWKVATFGESIAWKMLNEFAPSLAPIVRKGSEGVFDWIKERASDAATGVFNTLMAPVRTITGVGGKLSAQFTPLVATLQDAAAKIASNDCSPLRQAAEKIEHTAERIITPIIEYIQPIVAKIQDFLGGVWDKIGAPIWGWIQQYASQQWQGLKQLGNWIWKITEPMRALGQEAWGWLKKKIGIGDGPEGENGILQWVEAKLQSAWDWLKKKLEPFSKELAVIKGVVGEVAYILSPAGPVRAIGAVASQVGKGVSWIKDNLGKGDAVVKARVYLEKTLIPPLLGALTKMSSTVTSLAGSLSGVLTKLAKRMDQAVGAASGSVLSFAASAVQWIATQMDALAGWANQQLTSLAGTLQTAFGNLQSFLHGILEFLGKVGGVILDVWRLPLFLAGKVWNWVPACIRDPIVDFVIPIILKQIELFEELVRDNVAWQKTKADVMKLVRLVFVDHNLMGALKGTFDLILRTFNIPADLAVTVAKKAVAAWDVVVKKPLEFIKNTIKSLGHGFKLLWGNLTSHLEYGLKGWLLGGIADKDIQFPTDWTKPREVFGFVMDVLGLSVPHIFDLLKKRINPQLVTKAQPWIGKFQGAWNWVTSMIDTSKSPAENSKGVMDKAKDFGTSILTGVVEWVSGKVAQELATLAAAAAASGGLSEVVDIARRIYKAMLTAKRWAGQILQMANDTLDDVLGIASGAVEKVGVKFKDIMHKGMPVVIGFLADQVGLGGVGPAMRNIVDKLRDKVDEAVLWLIDKVKSGIEALINAVGGGKKSEPDERTVEQKQAALDQGVAEATTLLKNKDLSPEQVKKKLPAIKSRYNMTVLELVTDAKSATKETDHIHGAINPDTEGEKVEKPASEGDFVPEELTGESLWIEIASRINADQLPVGESTKISAHSLSFNSKVLLRLIDKSNQSEGQKRSAIQAVASNLMKASQSTDEKQIYRLVSAAAAAVNTLYAEIIATFPGKQLQAHHRPGVSESSPTFSQTRAGRKRASVARRIKDSVENLTDSEKAIAKRPSSERPALIHEYVQQLVEEEIQKKVKKGTSPLEEFDLDVLTREVHLGKIHGRE